MLLYEVLESPVPWKMKDTQEDLLSATFSVGDIEYIATFEKFSPTEWEFLFLQKGLKFGITGTGHEYKVFSTAVDILKHFIQKTKATTFEFSAKEPSRIKLYDRFAMMAEKMGWSVEKYENRKEMIYRVTKG